ncbi:MAG: Asp-tRNA(Asn)/Glu-tRNA(Gln) amidotransferase subunit GatC [candidate division WOR-3 bacterium]
MKGAKEKARWAIQLAKLEPTQELIEHMSKILGFLESFSELDLSDVEPLVSPLEGDTPLRDDEPSRPISRSEALRDAPDTQAGFFRCPRP